MVAGLQVQGIARTRYAVYYVYTEGSFPAERLREIMTAQILKSANAGIKSANVDKGGVEELCFEQFESTASELLDYVFVEEVASDTELWDVLYHKVARLLLNFDFFKTPFVFQVKLVIIDSVAALFRAVHPTGDDGLQIPGTTP
eukprot:GHVQ01009280.1.p3 GENE.GHVQ01009280.1~~GHVQ01009280.1.p3  ORF type:complete len:144 (-),score=17.01 GHVQ01009280.1:3620-4051(-)